MSDIWEADDRGVARAAEILRAGGLVALPTETVYGLAGLASDARAVARIYETKARPTFNPLIAHAAGQEAAMQLVSLDRRGRRLAEAFWPGPLTLVAPRREGTDVADLASAGLPSLAVRVPSHPVFRAVLGACGAPLVAPSANRSGRVSPTTAAHVAAEFEGRVPVLDGGACRAGLESTIVSLTGGIPTILRPGPISQVQLEAVVGPVAAGQPDAAVTAPGMTRSHYAPDARVRLNAETARDDEVLLGFGGTPGAALDLSASGDLAEAAANLFAMMRALDGQAAGIAVAPIPEEGLGVAINDRLSRAAAPRG